MYTWHLLIRQCYLQLVVVHHLVADRRQEELLVLLQPWACLVVHGHGHPNLFKTHSEFVLAFRYQFGHNRRVVRAELIQRKLRTDRIHCLACDPPSITCSARFSSFSIFSGHTCSWRDNRSPDNLPRFLLLTHFCGIPWRPDQLNNGSKWKWGQDFYVPWSGISHMFARRLIFVCQIVNRVYLKEGRVFEGSWKFVWLYKWISFI